MLCEHNDSLTVFIPKDDDPNDFVEIIRPAGDTRPLALKNADNKAVCATYNRPVRKMLTHSACSLQR